MVTYDPKRSRPVVDVEVDQPAPVEQLVELPQVDLPEVDIAEPVTLDVPRVVNFEVSPSPFEPAGPPDQRLGKAIAIGITAAGVLALMVAWRRRQR